jgi:uncharacterized repeat protein (TIGR02543 family)
MLVKARRSALCSLLLAAGLSACGGASDVPSSTAGALAQAVSANGATADLTFQSDWGAGYCANVVVTNGSASPVTSWTLVIELNQSTVSQQPWGATATQSGTQLTVKPVSYTAAIAPGTSVSFGFCGAATGSTYRPALVSLAVVGGGPGGPTTYALTVQKAGTGGGTVTGSAIDCGATCTASYASGTTVTLTAVAASGSTFAGWGGVCVGTAPCPVSMTDARTAIATFDPVVSGTGTSVNVGGSATGSFLADAWYSGGSTYTTTNAIDTSLLASPVPPQAVLQTERYGEFTYTIPDRAPGTAQSVTLYFVESYWTAAGQRTFNVAINGAPVLTAFDIYAAAGANRALSRTFNTTASSSGQVVVQLTKGGGPDNPKLSGITVTGQAGSPTSYTLGVTRSGTGSGTVTGGGISCGGVCSASIASGTSVTLTATAASGSTFAGWTGPCNGTASTCAFSMTGAQSVTATFTAGGAFNPCPATGDCRVLPFGDSITDGYVTVAGAYRIPLFSTAHAAGKHLTFVGSLVNGPTTVDGVAFPRNHEGHSGWTISQITALVPSPALNTPPHVVLLMIGTNDMYGSSTGVPAAIQRLDALLGKLVSSAPNALIVVAQITPLGDAGREALVRSYNAGLPAIVNARAAQGQHVVLVDMHTNFPTSELADGTHPTSAGYTRMASVWYAAIGSLLR